MFSPTELGYFLSKHILQKKAPSALSPPDMGLQYRFYQLHQTLIWYVRTKDRNQKTQHLIFSQIEAISYPVAFYLSRGSSKFTSELLIPPSWVVALEMVIKAVNLPPYLHTPTLMFRLDRVFQKGDPNSSACYCLQLLEQAIVGDVLSHLDQLCVPHPLQVLDHLDLLHQRFGHLE